ELSGSARGHPGGTSDQDEAVVSHVQRLHDCAAQRSRLGLLSARQVLRAARGRRAAQAAEEGTAQTGLGCGPCQKYCFRPTSRRNPDGSMPRFVRSTNWYRPSTFTVAVRLKKYSTPPSTAPPTFVSDSPKSSPLSFCCTRCAAMPAPANGCHLPPSQL